MNKSKEILNLLEGANGPMLNPDQIKEVQREMIQKGDPVRFMYKGQNLNIETGSLIPKGTNVMHQIVYWNFSKETAKKIAKWLGVQAVWG